MEDKLKAIFADNLKRWLQKRNKSQVDLAKRMNVSSPTVSDWVNGKKMPRADKLQSIANWLSIDLTDLLMDRESSSNWRKFSNGSAVRIPVLGRVAAGIPLMAAENVIDWEEIPAEMARDGEYFALYIYGDSMEPRMCKGDIIVIRKQSDADDGDIVIALIDGQDACCKRLRKYEDGTIALVSTNPAYKPLYFTPEEQRQTPVEVIGKVKELRGRL